jgi:tetratricopeptide (TPR) repeat protein
VTPKLPAALPYGFGPEQAFERAATLYRLGRLGEAEALYRAILNIDPEHFGALNHLGIIAAQLGRPQEAEQLIRRALVQNPRSSDARNNLGMLLAGLGRFDEALAEYTGVVAIDPGNIEARNNLGNTLHMLGRSGEAIPHFEEATAARPDIAELHNNLGNALRVTGRETEAIASFGKALAHRPDFAEAHNNLGVALAAIGRLDESVAEYKRAIALRQRYFEAHSNLANALAALDRHEEAFVQFGISLAINAGAPGTLNNFGNLLAKLKRYDEAIQHYLSAIAFKPNYFEAHNNLGNALAASDPSRAITHFRKAIEINPLYADAHHNFGNVLGGQERYEEAIACYRSALDIEPKMAETFYCLGNALITLGRISEGRDALEQAIFLAPDHPEFYRSLGECSRFAADDPHLATMEALARDMISMAEDQRIVLHFALGKAYDDLQRHEAAFHHFREANRLKRRQIEYDEATTLGIHTRVSDVFTPALMRGQTAQGDPSARPVFILGMPRSGTTLIEQMLASHPGVFGAGETLAFHNSVQQVISPHAPSSRAFPEAVATLPAEQLRRIGEQYLRHMAALAPEADRITDKALGNFVFAGLIHLALPNARIIHACRNPVDTCLSCFSKLFAGELLYTYDLGELGRYYRSYAKLMEHWRQTLPDGVMIEVQYEDLVQNFETQARGIIKFCGLDWDDRCLAFHQTQRPVRTASATQVRKPIYGTSVGRWRSYEAVLGPLLEELRQ